MLGTMDKTNQSFLYKLNPSVKILLIVSPSILVTFSYDPFLPTIFLVAAILTTVLFGNMKFIDFLRTIKSFVIIAIGFILFSLVTRGLSSEGNIKFLFFSWHKEDIILSITLGLRILTIISLSASFVKTTDPVKFILSLIQQLKLPYVVGYSTLTAYRFLPTFKDELEKIRLAHIVRGVEDKRGLAGKIELIKRYFVPMLATAIRKGEKVALAMESKAFGTYKERTFYKEIKVEKDDKVAMVIWFAFCLGVVIALKYLKVLKLGTGIGV